MKRRLLSLFVAFAMTVSMVVVGAGAVEPTYGDTAGHWAESAIERWSGHGIIQGSNGQFDPNGPLTCAQLATILAKLLKLPAAKDAGFTDNTADAWYYDAINRCAAAGILNGNGDGTVTPEAPITRERAMVMLARALGIEPIRKPDLTKYTDAAQVSAYAQGYVAALIEAGIVGGVTADELAPQDNINRASTVTILDRAISTYADKAGATIKADGKGIVLVVADDVTVTGDVDKLLVPADNVDVTVSGSKNIDDITVTGDNSKVILNNSTANDVTLDGKNTELETKSGSKVENVSVTEDAKGATVNAGSGTTIKNVENSAADTTVTGSGTVKNVASDTDITVETKNTNVENSGDEKITVTDAKGKDSTVSATGSGSSTTVNKETTSSGGGYSHSHSYDATTHKCSCGQADPAYAVASVSGKNYLTLSEAITAAQAGNKTMTLAADKTTTESIQAILDGQHGSIDGLTIELPSGTYDKLELARVVAETKDGLTYTCNHTDGTHYTFTDVDKYKSHLAKNVFHFTNTYTRTMSGVKLVANGDVTINGLLSESGHLHQKANPFREGYTGYYFNQKLTNFTFEGIKFVGNVNINTSSTDTEISNFTFKNCSFTTNGMTSDKGQAIRYYNENNNGKVSDLKVIDCTFTDCYQGVYTMKIKNVSVTGSSFDTTGHNAIAVQGEYCNHGVVQITGNTFANIGDRIIRFNKVGADTQITITNNTATNSGDSNGEVIKANSLADGVTCDISNNNWGNGTVNIPSDRPEMSAQIGEAQYETLAAAIDAAQNGDTIKLVSDITTNTTIAVTGDKAITIDFGTYTLTGASGVQVLHVGGTANVTLTATTGGINGGSGGDNVAIKAAENATINITSGNYTVGGDANDSGNSTVYVVGNGKVKISGGTFSSEKTYQNKYYVLNLNNSATGSISVTGGTFVGQNPGDGDDNLGGTFLAPDYKSVETSTGSGVWTVEKKDWKTDYNPNGTEMPSGVEIVNNADGTFVITLKDETAFYYFTQVFDRAAAFEARKDAWDAGTITKYPYEYNLSSLNMWYGPYCNRITVKMGCDEINWNEEAIKPFGFGGYVVNFDGNNCTIKNAKIEASIGDVGFFAARVNIKNVTLDSIRVSATGCNSAGVVAGSPNSIITGVTVKNSSVTGGKYTGAIAGYDYGDITNCKVENSVVSGQYKVGGIVGYVCTDNVEQQRNITGNTLTGVTVKGENLWPEKSSFVIGKIVGNWNAANGSCTNNTFDGMTDPTDAIGEIESGCTVTTAS